MTVNHSPLLRIDPRCPLCGKDYDFPLWCNECDTMYCVDCYNRHLLDFLPNMTIVRQPDGHLGVEDMR